MAVNIQMDCIQRITYQPIRLFKIMSVSPKLDKNEKLSSDSTVAVVEPIRKSSKYVMTCGTPSPPPAKSPEMATTKNAQNSFTSFSISSILSKQNKTEKANSAGGATVASDSKVTSEPAAAISLHPPPASFMSHLGSSSSMHSCTTDSSLMLSRYVYHFYVMLKSECLLARGSFMETSEQILEHKLTFEYCFVKVRPHYLQFCV